MSLGKKLTTFAAALVLAGSAFAGDEVCPSLSDIQAEGISMAAQINFGLYIGYSMSNFNTSYNWGFGIVPVQADSEDEAIDISNEILSNMTAPGVPDETDTGELVCFYETGSPNIYAVAVQSDYVMSPMKLKQYILRAH